jgi:MFS family permease
VQRKTWALIAYGAVAMLMTGMIGPLMPLYLKSIHFPVTEIGVIISVGGFTSAILALFFGNLTERFNRTRLFLGSAVVLAVLPLGFVFARGAGQFIGLELSSGVVGSLVAVTSQAMLMDMAKETGTPGQM